MNSTQTRQRSAQRATAKGPWHWRQRWSDLLFTHWRISPDMLRPHLPPSLDLDTWDGSPWVSLVAFGLGVRHRVLPSFGLTGNIIELNLRTYVVHEGVPGIYFLSIHADTRLAVALARWLTPLPYVHARMDYQRDGIRCFRCRQVQGQASLDVEFEPRGACMPAPPGSRAEWLLERYVLYAADRRGALLRTFVEHPPWRFHEVKLDVRENTIAAALGLDLRRKPDDVHWAAGVEAHVWPFERIV